MKGPASRMPKQLQADLARLSKRGRQTVVEGSGHMIHFEAPDAVVSAVSDVVAEVGPPWSGSRR